MVLLTVRILRLSITRRIQWLGTRKALVLGNILYGVGFLSFTWVKSFDFAIGSIVIIVAGEMLFVPPAFALIGQISKPEDRGKNMGLYGLFNTLGLSLGPLLGGFLLDRYPTSPLYLWGPVSLCSFLAAIGFVVWRGYSDNKTAAP